MEGNNTDADQQRVDAASSVKKKIKDDIKMSQAVREYLELKLTRARMRIGNIAQNPSYEPLELGPECSKAFGFPDNSMI